MQQRRSCFEWSVIPTKNDPANVQQISSKRRAVSTRILNTFAESLLDVCWIV